MIGHMRTFIDLFEDRIEVDEVTAWHGSPHRFKTFDIEKIGSGEGHAAYGWGLYFASQRDVADYYRRSLGKLTYKGRTIRSNQERLRSAAYQLLMASGDKDEAKRCDTSVADLIDQMNYDDIGVAGGGVYEVELPDDDKFLNWDVPFKEQSRFVKSAFRKLTDIYRPHAKQVMDDNDPGEVMYRHLGNYNRNVRRVDDEDKQTSLDLLKAGIVGIRYADGESRDKDQQTFNYVVFDHSVVKIVAHH